MLGFLLNYKALRCIASRFHQSTKSEFVMPPRPFNMEMWKTRKTPQMMFFENWLENNKTLQRVQQMRNFLTQLENPASQAKVTLLIYIT